MQGLAPGPLEVAGGAGSLVRLTYAEALRLPWGTPGARLLGRPQPLANLASHFADESTDELVDPRVLMRQLERILPSDRILALDSGNQVRFALRYLGVDRPESFLQSTDGGSNWEPVSDKFFKTGSVGAIAVSESDPNVIYVGMGESHIRGNTSQLSMFGILLHHSDGNTIAANEAAPLWSDGNQCDGIALFASHNNRVVDNTAANDVPHGIRVAPGSHGNVVRGNVVFQNGGDGILVSNKATTLEYNQATRNQGWGINAVRGVTASGNRAAENFGPGQCRNVTCEPATPPV